MQQSVAVSHEGWEQYYREQNGERAWNGVPDAFLLKHLEELLTPGASTVIDVAAGDGRNAVPFLERGLSVLCVDLSPSALAAFGKRCEASESAKPLLLVGDFFKLDLLAEQFDCAICFNALSHFESPILGLQRIGNLLARGGRAAFNAFTTHDVAYGEGEELGRHRFAYKDTLFTFMDEDEIKEAMPKTLRVLRSETQRWREPAHGNFRLAPHTHEAAFFIVERL